MRRALLAGLLLAAAAPALAQEPPAAGVAAYRKWCAGCHGEEGAGDGPAAARMLPRPRDFTQAAYELRTTASGELPTDDDVLRVILEGMPGTAMPGWERVLSESEREGVLEVLKSFAPFFANEDPPEPLEVGGAEGGGAEGIEAGRATYERIECWKCHGVAGRGDGPSAPTLVDDRDLPVRAADLTEGWLFNGGGSTEEIFTRLLTGLNGTPMPSFADLIEAEVLTREDLWNVAHYVRSLSPEEPPVVREVVRAARVEDALPATLDDPAWEEVDRFYLPLVGQVVVEPRWFAPRVDGVWVQALHDGERLALRLVWHDPSRSPDAAWDEWIPRVEAAMAGETPPAGPGGGGGAAPAPAGPTPAGPAPAAPDSAAPAAPAAADTAAAPTGPPGRVDALAVQFPTTIPEGMERPYFLMGSSDEPVYLWTWESGPAGAREALGTGPFAVAPLAGATGALVAEATWEDGEWRLLLVRPLEAGGVENRLGFEAGRAIPLALFAWDGDNGESGTKAAISTWYFLWLDPPRSNGVVVWPLAAALATAALGVVVVGRAQRRSRREQNRGA